MYSASLPQRLFIKYVAVLQKIVSHSSRGYRRIQGSKEPDAKYKNWAEIEMTDDIVSISRSQPNRSLSC